MTTSALICLAASAQADSFAEITYQSCRVCHDTAEGARIPALAGRSVDELNAALAGIDESPQTQTIMHRFTAGFTAEETLALAEYIASLKGPSL